MGRGRDTGAGSLWDQLAQRKRRTLEARARTGESLRQTPFIDEESASTPDGPRNDEQQCGAETLPEVKDDRCTVRLAGVTLPFAAQLPVTAMALQIVHDGQPYPLTLRQHTVPESMSFTQQWDQALGAFDADANIEWRPIVWCGHPARSGDITFTDAAGVQVRRVRGVLLPCTDGRRIWLDAHTQCAHDQRDHAGWLVAFDALLDHAALLMPHCEEE